MKLNKKILKTDKFFDYNLLLLFNLIIYVLVVVVAFPI